MEDEDTNVRILVNMIFNERAQQKMIEGDISIPNCILGKDFSERIQRILFIRKQITAYRWRKYFDTCYKMMLSSHEMFLRFVLFACLSEEKCHQNIFKSFLSACALVELLCDETLQKAGVDFCHLNSDIIMVFYRFVLKVIFVRRGGFQRLVEYIRGHRYLSWKSNKDYSDSPAAVKADLDEKIEKELKRDHVTEKETDFLEAICNDECKIMAHAVLSVTLAKLPTLPSYLEMLDSMIAYKKKEMSKAMTRNETGDKSEDLIKALNECSGSNLVSKTNRDVKHQENIERYDNVIQAAIRHNQSKSSSKAIAINRIQDGTDGVLQHLKVTIKSLIEALDKYDK